jgi:ParB-like chromosome segregation protein Spo0J
LVRRRSTGSPAETWHQIGPASRAELAASIARQGLQHPIAVKRAGPRWLLIAGRRRLEAYRTTPALGSSLVAEVYPEEMPGEWARILEIDENANRQDLTPDERAAHSIELAAAIKSLEEKARSESLTKSDFTEDVRSTTGRGHKGIVQKVAERQKVDQAAVRKRAKKVAETIGEPVDLDRDPPAELRR